MCVMCCCCQRPCHETLFNFEETLIEYACKLKSLLNRATLMSDMGLEVKCVLNLCNMDVRSMRIQNWQFILAILMSSSQLRIQ